MKTSMDKYTRTMDEYLEEEAYLANKIMDKNEPPASKMMMVKKLSLIHKEMKELDASYVPEHELSEL